MSPQRVKRFLYAQPALSTAVGLLLPLVLLRVVLLGGQRVPMGHDALYYLQFQYTFFNEAALTGAPPQWLPFMTHGTPSNLWVMMSEGLLLGVLYPVARFLRDVNFLYVYHAGLLFDEFVLLLGCVLLGRRYFSSWAAVIFTTAAITYTATSSVQPWWDFHLVYSLPLLLYCADRAVRDASARYLSLLGALSVTTLIGNLPYFPPLIGFTLFVFGAAAAATAPREAVTTLKRFIRRLSWRHAAAVAVPLALLGALALFLDALMGEFVYFNERNQSGEVASLSTFLTYGGYTGFWKYSELFGRYSNNLDNTIYRGMLVVPFVLLTLLRPRSASCHSFGISTVVILFFSAGTIVSATFYHLVPYGNYFRHIGLVAPIAMLFLVFYAGHGFDAFWTSVGASGNGRLRDRVNLYVPLFALVAALLLVLSQAWHLSGVFDFALWPWGTLTKVVLFIGVHLAVLLAMLIWPRRATLLAATLLALHVTDVFTRNFELEYERVPAVGSEIVDLFRLGAYEFAHQRSQDYARNPRFATIAPALFTDGSSPVYDRPYSPQSSYGELYSSAESFLFFDAGTSIFRADHWLKGVDAFYSAFLPPNTPLERWHRGFPIPDSSAYRKLIGFDLPELQLFSRIHVLPDDSSVSSVLSTPGFTGDQLLGSVENLGVRDQLASLFEPAAALLSPARAGDISLTQSDRLSGGSVAVEEFTFDRLRLSLDTGRRTDWSLLYYADAWHPNWHAAVDGRPVPVLRANLGYKAVPVPPGQSEVVLSFGDIRSHLLLWSTIGAAIFAVSAVIYLTATLSGDSSGRSPSSSKP